MLSEQNEKGDNPIFSVPYSRKDARNRQAVVESLKEKIKRDPKKLVGNKGYRKYLKIERSGVSIDQDKIEFDSRFDGKWMLKTNLAFLGITFGIVLAVSRLSFGAAEGVFTLFAVLFFFIGAQFLAFGVMGEYVGRIYREVKKRPPYTIRRVY